MINVLTTAFWGVWHVVHFSRNSHVVLDLEGLELEALMLLAHCQRYIHQSCVREESTEATFFDMWHRKHV